MCERVLVIDTAFVFSCVLIRNIHFFSVRCIHPGESAPWPRGLPVAGQVSTPQEWRLQASTGAIETPVKTIRH